MFDAWLKTLVKSPVGSYKLFRFWGSQLKTFRSLDPRLRNASELNKELAQQPQSFEIPAPLKHATQYNEKLDILRGELRLLHPTNERLDFGKIMFLQFALRFMLCLLAVSGASAQTVVIVSLLQFLLGPYSFFVNVTYAAAGSGFYLAHYIASVLVNRLMVPFLPVFCLMRIQIDWSFFVGFMVTDQLISIFCHYYYGVPNRGHMFAHFVFGFLNAKSYFMVLLPLFIHQRFDLDLLPLAVIGVLTAPITLVLTKHLRLNFLPLFYHQHRMAHLPPVYNEAHKFHHYLHSSTSYDAHLYGSGMCEEWSTLIIEITGALVFGLPPLSLNPLVIYKSCVNKLGHTRMHDPHLTGVNNHVEHHEFHDKNYSTYNPMLDIFFGTHAPNALHYQNYLITRTPQALAFSHTNRFGNHSCDPIG